MAGLAGCGNAPAPESIPPPPLRAGQTINVTFCNDQTARITAPANVDRPVPAAVYIHGGSWIGGHQDTGGFIISEIGPALNAAGIMVVNVNYRLGPDAQWPAQIEDVKSAVRYLRAYAKELHIDPQRIGTWGQSAGGQLASLLGTAGRSAGWDKGDFLEYSSSVEAVADLSGPANLVTMGSQGASGLVQANFIKLLGGVPLEQIRPRSKPQARSRTSPRGIPPS